MRMRAPRMITSIMRGLHQAIRVKLTILTAADDVLVICCERAAHAHILMLVSCIAGQQLPRLDVQ